MTVPSASEIRLTVESFPGATNTAKRAAIFSRWKEVQQAVVSGVRSLSIPGLNGALDGDAMQKYLDLLTACLDYLDGIIGDDPGASAAEPMGHTVDFSKRPMIW
jgi:hypothetical protein